MKLNVRLPFMKSEMKYFHCPILRWLAPNRQWVDIPSVEYLYEDEEGCVSRIVIIAIDSGKIFLMRMNMGFFFLRFRRFYLY